MSLDVPTLMFSGAFVCVLCGGFLSFAWWQYRATAAIWWAAAFLTLGLAVSWLAASFFAHPAFFPIGLILLIASPALVWCGVCRFFGTPIRALPIAAAFALWLVTLGSMPSLGREWITSVLHTLLVVALNGAVIWELMRNRNEQLRARVPLVMLTALNIAIYLMAIPEALEGGLRGAEPPRLASMFGLIHFETMLYAIGATVFLVALIKERSEQKNLRDAETDMLTGLANRRAFIPMAERVADRCRKQGEPCAVVVFDLDHFKSVNDRFGHPFGDAVLATFGRIVRETLRPGDLVSRAGGEEFFAILPGADLKHGCSTAKRVCQAFEAAAVSIDGRPVGATVSAGVMATEDGDISLAKLLERADAALYRAKVRGRNCVQCGLEEPDRQQADRQLVRVA